MRRYFIADGVYVLHLRRKHINARGVTTQKVARLEVFSVTRKGIGYPYFIFDIEGAQRAFPGDAVLAGVNDPKAGPFTLHVCYLLIDRHYRHGTNQS